MKRISNSGTVISFDISIGQIERGNDVDSRCLKLLYRFEKRFSRSRSIFQNDDFSLRHAHKIFVLRSAMLFWLGSAHGENDVSLMERKFSFSTSSNNV